MKNYIYILFVCLLLPTMLSGANFYWVGGSGNWSDINHWRTASGGTAIPNVIPGRTDDVFFDANSGFTPSSKTININVTAFCRNFTVAETTVQPTFNNSPTSAVLNIYGSMDLQENMTYNVYTTYFQDTQTPKTIKSNGVKLGSYLYFKETTSITLLDDVTLATNTYLNNGILKTNNNNIYITNLYTTGTLSTPRGIEFGSSDVYISGVLNSNYTGVTIDAGTSTLHFTKKIDTSAYGLNAYNGHTFYNVIYDSPESSTAYVSGNVTIEKLEFKGGGYFAGNITAKEVIFSPQKLYRIAAGRILTVTDKLSGGAVCGGWMTISSATEAVKASISMPATAIVDIKGAIIKDIDAIGGADFIAASSIDNGNNSGWSFPPSSGTNLYWVGGGGEWGDPSHWAETSGGTGGACVPGPQDNVYFDSESGFTTGSKVVKLNGVAYCKDIICSGSPVPPEFNELADAYSLNIYGSSEWQEGMVVYIQNVFYQNTNEDKTIKTNGVQYRQSITIKETGSVSLLDPLSTYTLTIESGTFNTNNFDLDLMYQFIANKDLPKVLNLGSSQIYFKTSGSRLLTQNKQTTINAGTSHIHFAEAVTINSSIVAAPGQKFYDLSMEHPNSKGGVAANPSLTTESSYIEFNKIESKGNFTVTGNVKVNEMYLVAGKVYEFESSRTLTINDRLVIGGHCLGWTTMKSTVSGSKATISMPSTASVEVNGALIKDIAAIGGADYVAINSIDQGNNEGWDFNGGDPSDLYWVGGAGNWSDSEHWATTSGGEGGACIPGPNDNVFFDANSGFTSTSKIVTIVGSSFCRNITVAGTTVQPTISSANNVSNELCIYGSSVWQAGMVQVSVFVIKYMDTKTPKMITSNGVTTGSAVTGAVVYFYETTSISMADDFAIGLQGTLEIGTFNTNDHKLTVGRSFYANSGSPKTLNLGKSDVMLPSYTALFTLSNPSTIVNASESNIVFGGGMSTSGYGLRPFAGQVFNNVIFTSVAASAAEITTSGSGEATFKRVELRGGGKLFGNNTYDELILLGNKKVTLGAGYTQTVNVNLNMSGTTCDVLLIESTSTSSLAKLRVLGGNTNFNFVNISNIDATGLPLHFGAQSTVANQNNNNVTFDPYDPGQIEGLGADRLCQVIDDDDPSSYTITTNGFYGNEYTQYSWKKVGSNTVIGTEATLDFRPFGYGEYTVDVAYSNGATITCRVSDNIIIDMTPSLSVQSPSDICISGAKTYISDVTSIVGTDIKWYATSDKTTILSPDTEIFDGNTYYLTQTLNGCESVPVELLIKLINCNKKVYINPNLRMKVSY